MLVNIPSSFGMSSSGLSWVVGSSDTLAPGCTTFPWNITTIYNRGNTYEKFLMGYVNDAMYISIVWNIRVNIMYCMEHQSKRHVLSHILSGCVALATGVQKQEYPQIELCLINTALIVWDITFLLHLCQIGDRPDPLWTWGSGCVRLGTQWEQH